MSLLSSPLTQWRACQTGCTIIPRSTGALIEVRGPERAAFLSGLFSRDVTKNFPIGSAVYGLFPTLKGKILADAVAAHPDDNSFLLDTEHSAADTLIKHLETYLFLSKAQVEKQNDYQKFSILGPTASSVLEKANAGVPSGPNRAIRMDHGFLMALKQNGMESFQIWVRAAEAANLSAKLQFHGASPVSEHIHETIRIESGIPRFGFEMDESTFPQEAGLDEVLDFKKGCYLGAEVLQRIFHKGHVNRGLVLFSSPVPLSAQTAILQEQTEVGRITSTTFSFRWNQPIALGIVKLRALLSSAAIVAANPAGEPVGLTVLKAFTASKTR